jgi:hypothetical protein
MNIKVLLSGILGVVVLVFFILVVFSKTPAEGTTPASQDTGSFPSPLVAVPVAHETYSLAATTNAEPTSSLEIALMKGDTIVTNDFLHNGVTIADAANTGRYLLAGNLGYCVSDPQKCQAGTQKDFTIYFDSTSGFFTIGIFAEPLGQVRLIMEQTLANALGIRQQDLCRLKYYVGTTSYVNPAFAGKNLGFSFCYGATQLPQ